MTSRSVVTCFFLSSFLFPPSLPLAVASASQHTIPRRSLAFSLVYVF